MRAVAFTGMPGAGKSEAVEAAKSLAVPVVRMGDAVWAEVRRRNLPLVDGEVGRVATEMREKHGRGIWAERTVDMIRDLKTDEVVIDGVRNIEEVETFRRLLGHDFVLVAIHASPSTRMARILTRRRADDATDETTFRQRDGRELSWGIGAVIALADLMIVNEGAVSDVKAAVRHILSEGRRAA